MFFRARRYSTGNSQEKGNTGSTPSVTPSSPVKYHRHLRTNNNVSAASNNNNTNTSSGGVGSNENVTNSISSSSRGGDGGAVKGDAELFPQAVSGSVSSRGPSSHFNFMSFPSAVDRPETSRSTTKASATAPSSSEERFRYKRPSSAPIKPVNVNSSSPQLPSFSDITSQFSAAGANNTTDPVFPFSSGRAFAKNNPRVTNSTGYLGETENLSTDLNFVEQRLKIIKRNRADRRHLEFSSSSNLSSPGASEESPSSPKQGSLRLLKHEQHAVDSMVTQCLDALLFPSTLGSASKR